MEISQKITLGILGLIFCEALLFLALTTRLVDGVEANCDPGTMCARPTRELQTLLGSIDARQISHDQYKYLQASLIIGSIITQFLIVRMLYVDRVRAASSISSSKM